VDISLLTDNEWALFVSYEEKVCLDDKELRACVRLGCDPGHQWFVSAFLRCIRSVPVFALLRADYYVCAFATSTHELLHVHSDYRDTMIEH
jgi:hypothetical protein